MIWTKFYCSIDEIIKDKVTIDQQSISEGVYFSVCPRQEERGDKNAVKWVWTLWADLDAKDFKGAKPEALERIKSFPIPCTIVVDSGNGYHAYWRLKEAKEIKGQQDVDNVEAYLRALAIALGADTAAAELARILRLPGTYNRKNPHEPKLVEVIKYNPDNQSTLSDFDQFLSLPGAIRIKNNTSGWIADSLLKLKAGNRHATFAKIIGKLHRDRLTQEDILAFLLPHAERTSFPVQELRREISSICSRYANDSISTSTPNNGGMETGSFAALSIQELLSKEVKAIEWAIYKILPKQGIGILSGLPNVGKSFMLLDLAIEMAKGGKWLGEFTTTPSKVLYIDEESSINLLQFRLNKLLKEKNYSKETLDVHFMIGQGFCLSDKASVSQLCKLMNQLKPNLVIIDSLIRVHTAEENSAKDMAGVFGVIKTIVRDFEAAFLFADHQKKFTNFVDGQRMLRGSTEKSAAIDTHLSLHLKDDLIIVEHSKSRSGQAIPAFTVRIQDTPKDGTVVSYIGEASVNAQDHRLSVAREYIHNALADGQWKSRQSMVEGAKQASISEKAIDEALDIQVKEGHIDREDRKPEKGRGGKQAFYRLHIDNHEDLFNDLNDWAQE